MARRRRSSTAPMNATCRMAKTARTPDSSRTPAWSPPAATRRPITASSIRRSITPRPCSIRPPKTMSRTARRYQYGRRGTPTIGGAGRRIARDRRRRTAPASRCCRRAWRRSRPRCCRSAGRRPRAGHRQRLPADAQFLRRRAQALRRRDDLLRSADRRRHRQADASRTRARCSSKRRARRASRCRTFRRSPPSRTTRARSC